MRAVDDLELEILERTGDLEAAQHIGEVARDAITYALDCLAAMIGVPADTLDAEAVAALYLTRATPLDDPQGE